MITENKTGQQLRAVPLACPALNELVLGMAPFQSSQWSNLAFESDLGIVNGAEAVWILLNVHRQCLCDQRAVLVFLV